MVKDWHDPPDREPDNVIHNPPPERVIDYNEEPTEEDLARLCEDDGSPLLTWKKIQQAEDDLKRTISTLQYYESIKGPIYRCVPRWQILGTILTLLLLFGCLFLLFLMYLDAPWPRLGLIIPAATLPAQGFKP